MVKSLSKAEEQSIFDAVKDIERKTSARVVPVILSSSSPYTDIVLFLGVLLGMSAGLALWLGGIVTYYPWLLTVQLGIIIFVDRVPFLRRGAIAIVPDKIRHQRAQRAAFEEFHAIAHGLPQDAPFVLLFVSLADRYVHVVTSPAVKRKLPDEHWQSVTQRFTDSIKAAGVRDTSVNAVRHIGEILAPHFPA
jgi:putative membrane protein